jgi:RNA polymerase sigma factor (TIGR02999 family)
MAGKLTRTTTLLADVANGRAGAADQLLPIIYDELRSLAAAHLRYERPDHTLQPTALVHEAYLRLIESDRVIWRDRAHFFALAAQAIRRVLVDHARARKTVKRGGQWRRLSITEIPDLDPASNIDLVELDAALSRLAELNERQAQVVMLRYFAGLTIEEAACVMGVNRSTVCDDWAIAKAWLATELAESEP